MTDEVHILVVEDDPLVSEVIAAALEERFQTTVVDTAAAAIDALRDSGVRLILLDCTLPGGLDPALIQMADRQGVPVVMMSGDRGRIEEIGCGPRPYLLKPFGLTSLHETVERVLGQG